MLGAMTYWTGRSYVENGVMLPPDLFEIPDGSAPRSTAVKQVGHLVELWAHGFDSPDEVRAVLDKLFHARQN
jgi:hypothetical protein